MPDTPRDDRSWPNGEAERLGADHWGLAGKAREVSSERDRVFEISDTSGPAAFLKVSNAMEQREILETEARMLETLAGAQTCYRFPSWRRTGDDRALIEHAIDGRPHFVRLLDAVPGTRLEDIRPHGPELLFQIGRLVGIVDRSLVDQPADDRPMIWDLRGAPTLIGANLGHIVDAAHRETLERVLDRHATFVTPRTHELRESLIYNDANPANVQVGPSKAGTPKVVGLVDFGDAVRSWTVADLAVACAYAGLDKRDPLGAFCHVARGYAAEHPVTEPEADVVFELARLRLALSVTISAVRAGQEPGQPLPPRQPGTGLGTPRGTGSRLDRARTVPNARGMRTSAVPAHRACGGRARGRGGGRWPGARSGPTRRALPHDRSQRRVQ